MNKWLIGCLSLLAVCLVLLLTYMALMRMPNPRTKRIDLDDLMVTRADFPQGWGTSGGGPIPGRENQRGSEETLGRHWIPEGLSEWGASQRIYRYRNVFQAIEAYFTENTDFFKVRGVSSWQVPAYWSYHSPVANQYRFACTQASDVLDSTTTTVCVARGQYDEFISVFSASIDPAYMTYADLERVLRAIDERMARALGKPLPPSVTPP